MQAQKQEKTIPAFPNHFPYNHLLLAGLLSVKTRNWKWNHAGITLLYDSQRTAWPVVKAYGLQKEAKTTPRGMLVGIGVLLPVRKMAREEKRQSEREFNNGRKRKEVKAGDYRYRFIELRRFKKPVPFKPPQGAVRTFRVPLRVVSKALKEIGLEI